MIHYALPPSLENDIFRFEQEFAEFRAGRLHETAFTAKRVKSESLCGQKEQIIAFGEDVMALYKNMDNTMRFPGERENMVIKAANQLDESLPSLRTDKL